ncbi:MAG TPA: hypothetical protein VJZ16_06265 [Syntrophales bacterium]|nr:hypothetical protein [Syntrophales bacterium]
MDKLRILKEFERLAFGDTLETDEIRLYLLLLAYCREAKGGEITYRTVKEALGEEFSPDRFKQACLRLSSNNLIKVVSPPLNRITVGDFSLVYRIFPYAENKEVKAEET